MYRWADHVGPDHVDRVRDAFDHLAGRVVGLRLHVHGNDVGVSADAFDFHVLAEFDDVTAWRAYVDHPEHVLLVEELLVGHVAEQATGQFQSPDDRSAPAPVDPEESDDELLARARRAAMAQMDALLAEPDVTPND